MTEINPETVAIFGDVVDSVRRAFDEGGLVACMIVCETEDGQRITFQAAGALDDQATVMKKLRRLFRRLRVARYVRVTKYSRGAVDACIHPSEDPNGGDGVMVLAVDRASVGMCSVAEIKRGIGGKHRLGPWEPLEISGGRRTCLIKARHSGCSDATDRC